jgi:hypothetical protein
MLPALNPAEWSTGAGPLLPELSDWLVLDLPLSERYEAFSPNGGEPGLEYTQKGH